MNRGKVQSILDKRAKTSRLKWVHLPLDAQTGEATHIYRQHVMAEKAAKEYYAESMKLASKLFDPKGISNDPN